MKTLWKRFVVVLAFSLVATLPSFAEGCEQCISLTVVAPGTFPLTIGWCAGVDGLDTGNTDCFEYWLDWGSTCAEYGDFCMEITVRAD